MPEDLVRLAIEARERAYAPYSGYRVGAAVLVDGGEVFAGTNIENVSYGLTVCAERTAVHAAVSAGHRRLAAIALATETGATPCGACRQVLREFAPAGLPVYLAAPDGSWVARSLGELLPDSFDAPSLRGR